MLRVSFVVITCLLIISIAIILMQMRRIDGVRMRFSDTNDANWGVPFHGIAVSVSANIKYKLTKNIDVNVRVRNVSNSAIRLYNIKSSFRPSLYNSEGNSLPLTPEAEKVVQWFGQPRNFEDPMLEYSLAANEEHQETSFSSLNKWFLIREPGNYYLIILRELDRGFAISNLAEIQIVE